VWVNDRTTSTTTMMMMKSLSILIILVSVAESFSPSATTSSTATSAPSTVVLALATSINTRHRIENQELGIYEQTSCRDATTGKHHPRDAVSGHERRASFASYAPPHGSPPTYGAVGCPGGGDWCHPSSFAAAGAPPPGVGARKRAATVAAALAGLGEGAGGARELGSVGIPKSSSSGSSTSMAGLLLASFDSRLASSTTGGGGGGGGGGSSVMGEDVRESRASYAPFDHYGRVGILGEIGDEKSAHRPAPMARMAGALPPSYSSSPPKKSMVSKSTSGKPKKYGLGSWKK